MDPLFFDLSDMLIANIAPNQVLLCTFSGEDSDFVRFNHAAVRQAGNIRQGYLSLKLIEGRKHVSGTVTLSGCPDTDRTQAMAILGQLKEIVPHLPEDPHLLYAQEVHSTERIQPNTLPTAPDAVDSILSQGSGIDLVGIYASGDIYAGFANSLGQRNWFESHSFHFDWSVYHCADKAVKFGYAGTQWNDEQLALKMNTAKQQLQVMARPAKTISPGEYRAYLSPTAVNEMMELLCWGGFGLKDQRTKQSTLIQAVEGKAHLDPQFSLSENTGNGLAPGFQSAGFIRPDSVVLFDKGQYQNALVSPRSAKEYGVTTNGANASEMPESLDMGSGTLDSSQALSQLDQGVYVNNLWYLNYSDRPSCRVTGMTRFATFWVENGEIVAPLSVMRFDDTFYRAFGTCLDSLTSDREFILDCSTYEHRSTRTARLPGAIVNQFRFTL